MSRLGTALLLATLVGPILLMLVAHALAPIYPPLDTAPVTRLPVPYCPSKQLGGLFVPCRYVKWEGRA